MPPTFWFDLKVVQYEGIVLMQYGLQERPLKIAM